MMAIKKLYGETQQGVKMHEFGSGIRFWCQRYQYGASSLKSQKGEITHTENKKKLIDPNGVSMLRD